MTQTAPGCSNLLHLLDCFLFPMPIDEPWKLPLWHKIETRAQKVWKDSKAKTCRLLIKIEILVSQFPVFESTFASHATNSIDNTFSWQIINKGLSPSLSILKVVHQIYQCCAIFWRIQLIKKNTTTTKETKWKIASSSLYMEPHHKFTSLLTIPAFENSPKQYNLPQIEGKAVPWYELAWLQSQFHHHL